ncbi:protein kinase domain-containing protein [Spirillospora sp. CA-294931]|uniref:protein kinase domain-containing protein n=1 Tax=Spirillospora sp. CA-294931 TaxID=3240042 RepID=UPI003D8D81CB
MLSHDLIGPYRVLERLGEGGMGTVYLGVDDAGRKVAIKVIRREHAADAQYRARFAAEVAAAQRVRPFCTAPVLSADPGAEPPYLVTEFVNGPSLSGAVAKDGPLRGADLEALAVGMATALTAIHDAGVVHRDLKPANVLLSPLGPRVIDFGIARSVEAARLTATGVMVGTPAFMAPEQLSGSDAVPASDVWAWGATVAFAARGSACFTGGTVPAIIHQILSGEPDLSGLDGTVLTVVRAAMAKDPAHRPTAQQLLERLISSGGQPAPTPQQSQAPAHPRTQDGPTPSLRSDEAAVLVERQYRVAAETGDTTAMQNLGALLSQRGQNAEAEYWYRRAATQPQTQASNHGYQTGYNQPYGQQQPPLQTPVPGHDPSKNNSVAIYALTFGIVGLFTCGLPSIPAIIAGHLAWNQIRRTGQRGMGLALTGIALGWVMVAIWVLLGIGTLLPDSGTTTE